MLYTILVFYNWTKVWTGTEPAEPEPWGSGQGLEFARPNLEVQVQVLARMAWTWTGPDHGQSTYWRPNYISSFTTHIPDDKLAALVAAEEHHQEACVTIYCDRSRFENNIGTSAVLYINAVETNHLQYHLSPATNHTVYEEEIVGLSLALHMLSTLWIQLHIYTVIGTDSQATILTLNNQHPHPAHYLLDHVYYAAEILHTSQHHWQSLRAYKVAKHKGKPHKQDIIDLQVHWTQTNMQISLSSLLPR